MALSAARELLMATHRRTMQGLIVVGLEVYYCGAAGYADCERMLTA
jgi:hypothetical protein